MKHPYQYEFERTLLWKTVENVISSLQQNRDIELATTKEHVVGYICQQLSRQQIVDRSALVPTAN